jgi:hypothetical protein
LQQAFREAAARLAAKHGVEVPQHDEDGSEDEGESGSEAGGEDGSADEGEDGSEGAAEGEQAAAAAAAAAAARGRKRGRLVVEEEGEEGLSSNDEEGESESESEQYYDDAEQQQQQQEEEEAAAHPTKALKQQQRQQQQQQDKVGGKSAAASAELDGPLDLSFTPAVPGTYQEFEALVGARPADQLQLAIQRIRTFNAAALATDHKRKLQVGGGVLQRVRAPWMSDRVLSEPYFDGLWRMLLLPSDVWGTCGCLLGGWLLLLLLLLLLLPLLGMMSHASLQTSRCTLKNTLLTVPLS